MVLHKQEKKWSVFKLKIEIKLSEFTNASDSTRKNIKRKFEKVFLWLTICRIHLPLNGQNVH